MLDCMRQIINQAMIMPNDRSVGIHLICNNTLVHRLDKSVIAYEMQSDRPVVRHKHRLIDDLAHAIEHANLLPPKKKLKNTADNDEGKELALMVCALLLSTSLRAWLRPSATSQTRSQQTCEVSSCLIDQ